MTLKEYATAVQQLRKLQTLYFKTRDRSTMLKSIEQEKLVDRLTQEVLGVAKMPDQGKPL